MSTKKTTIALPSVVQDLSSSPTNEADSLRLQFGSWVTTTEGIQFLDTSDDSDIILESITAPIDSTYPRLGSPNYGLELSRKQTISISENQDPSTTTPESWEENVRSIISFAEHEYLVTSFENPLIVEEALNMDANAPGAPAGVKYVYNYYDSNYEELLAPVRNHEVIQNLYSMFDASSIIGTDVAGDEILDVDILPVVRGGKSATLSKALRFNRSRLSERRKFQNQIVPIENMPLLADYEGSKYLFPMYVDINIPLDKNIEFVKLCKDTSMSIALTRDVEGVTDTDDVTPAPSVRTQNMSFTTSVVDPAGEELIQNSSIPVKVVDLLEWTDEDAPAYAFDFAGYPPPSNFYFIGAEAGSYLEGGTFNKSIAVGTASTLMFGTFLDTFKQGLESIAEDKRKRIRGIFNGKESYSETVMYKIQKLEGPIQNPVQAPIQTYHFMNSAEVEEFLNEDKEFKFVDTQVKFNQEYSYIVTAYQMIVGERYVYDNLQIQERFTERRTASVDVHMTPTIKLVEFPVFASTGRILDYPPLQPEIRFFPVVSDRNKLKMFFTTSTGNEDVAPIALNDEEQSAYDQVAINQNRNDGLITFKSDDSAASFQIYRMESPPAIIEDFANRLYATVTTSPFSGLPGASATAEIAQFANTKYYYMFRTIDVHGGISNPSAIYEIELYNDGGAGYPIIRHYDLSSPNPKTPTKSARKIIQIIPRIAQVFLNEEASGLVDSGAVQPAAGNKNIVLGNQTEPLFGKKFKIRLTSKSTGKKVDLNVNFKTKRLQGEIES
jgi:hypothetical protein